MKPFIKTTPVSKQTSRQAVCDDNQNEGFDLSKPHVSVFIVSVYDIENLVPGTDFISKFTAKERHVGQVGVLNAHSYPSYIEALGIKTVPALIIYDSKTNERGIIIDDISRIEQTFKAKLKYIDATMTEDDKLNEPDKSCEGFSPIDDDDEDDTIDNQNQFTFEKVGDKLVVKGLDSFKDEGKITDADMKKHLDAYKQDVEQVQKTIRRPAVVN